MRRIVFFATSWVVAATVALGDPLPSWSEGPARDRLIAFVEAVTDPANADFVAAADRIAVFDNDGTLWGEQPAYFQFLFALDRLKAMAAEDPAVLENDVLKAAAEGDLKTVLEAGEEGLLEVVNATHAGLAVAEFQAEVLAWLETARHPSTGLRYDAMTYQPMVELLRYLRDEGFETFIVSGGGIHFMRAFTEAAYGIPSQNVVGTLGETKYETEGGEPRVVKAPGIAFLDDKEGKPIGIDRAIGKRPILAGGNSDGDFAMIEWTTAGPGPRLGLIIHHTDADREFAYDRDSAIGRLNDGLDKGPGMGWLIVNMAKDWDRIYTGAR
ncbi:MAG: HAD family hydrolase [Pseudomonadota bacterium]